MFTDDESRSKLVEVNSELTVRRVLVAFKPLLF